MGVTLNCFRAARKFDAAFPAFSLQPTEELFKIQAAF
jgi:hypothetical protein